MGITGTSPEFSLLGLDFSSRRSPRLEFHSDLTCSHRVLVRYHSKSQFLKHKILIIGIAFADGGSLKNIFGFLSGNQDDADGGSLKNIFGFLSGNRDDPEID
jgi:hypothetical protein